MDYLVRDGVQLIILLMIRPIVYVTAAINLGLVAYMCSTQCIYNTRLRFIDGSPCNNIMPVIMCALMFYIIVLSDEWVPRPVQELMLALITIVDYIGRGMRSLRWNKKKQS